MSPHAKLIFPCLPSSRLPWHCGEKRHVSAGILREFTIRVRDIFERRMARFYSRLHSISDLRIRSTCMVHQDADCGFQRKIPRGKYQLPPFGFIFFNVLPPVLPFPILARTSKLSLNDERRCGRRKAFSMRFQDRPRHWFRGRRRTAAEKGGEGRLLQSSHAVF